MNEILFEKILFDYRTAYVICLVNDQPKFFNNFKNLNQMMRFRNLRITDDQKTDGEAGIDFKGKVKKLLRPTGKTGKLCGQEIIRDRETSSEEDNDGAIFHLKVDRRCYIDIRKIIVEWQSYQEERFCQIRVCVSANNVILVTEVISKNSK